MIVGLGTFGLSLTGDSGDDRFIGTRGNDTIDGAGGTDTAVFSGNLAAFTLTIVGHGVQVAGPDGTDTLLNVERFQFNDQTVNAPGLTKHSDFNGDGFSDVLWRNNSSGDTGYTDFHAGNAWHGLGASSTAYNVVGDRRLQRRRLYRRAVAKQLVRRYRLYRLSWRQCLAWPWRLLHRLQRGRRRRLQRRRLCRSSCIAALPPATPAIPTSIMPAPGMASAPLRPLTAWLVSATSMATAFPMRCGETIRPAIPAIPTFMPAMPGMGLALPPPPTTWSASATSMATALPMRCGETIRRATPATPTFMPATPGMDLVASSTAYSVVAVGDYSGDGFDDILYPERKPPATPATRTSMPAMPGTASALHRPTIWWWPDKRRLIAFFR